jgi:PAS domain S-box-containing protein
VEHSLRVESLSQLTALLELSSDAIIGTDTDGIIQTWNPSAESIYGYSPEEATGRSFSLLFAPEYAAHAAEILDRAATRGDRVENLETVHLTATGQRLGIRLNTSPVRDAEGRITGTLTVARDASEYQQTRNTLHQLQELQASSHHRAVIMETASRVALDILSSRTGVEALRHIADAARILANARYAAMGVARPDAQSLSEFVTVGLTPEEEARIGPRPRGAGVLGLLLKRSEPLRVNVLGDHPASVGFPPNHPPMDSFLGVPIRRGDMVLGSLYLTNKQGGGAFTEADEVAVQALGAHAAVAIHNMHMLSRQHALVSGLITAQEEERRAVAYDLHDGLTQYVMASHAHLEAFRRAQQTGKQERAERELDQGLKYLKEAVVESRRLVNGLRSLALDDLGLSGAIEQLLHEEKARAGWVKAEFIHNVEERRFDKMLETAAYRVAQEALTNARKHAAATEVRVLLLPERDERTQAEYLRLQVRDWGCGFEPQKLEAGPGHVGLHGMAERAHLLGASYSLRSAIGQGTIVEAVFPALDPQPENDTQGNAEVTSES